MSKRGVKRDTSHFFGTHWHYEPYILSDKLPDVHNKEVFSFIKSITHNINCRIWWVTVLKNIFFPSFWWFCELQPYLTPGFFPNWRANACLVSNLQLSLEMLMNMWVTKVSCAGKARSMLQWVPSLLCILLAPSSPHTSQARTGSGLWPTSECNPSPPGSDCASYPWWE